MKKIVAVIIFVVAVLVPCSGCIERESDRSYVSRKLSITIPKAKNIGSEDTHNGFHGDGKYIVTIEFEEQEGEKVLDQIKQKDNWEELPLDQTLQMILYGGTKGDSAYAYNFAAESGVPEVEQGYYCFMDLQYQNQGTGLLYRSSFDFMMGMYDTENNILYFIQVNT